MAVISFLGTDCWFASNRALRRLNSDVRKRFQLSEEDDYLFNVGEAMSGIHFSSMEPEVRSRIMGYLKEAATAVANDTEGALRDDVPEESYDSYRTLMAELMSLIQKYEHVEWPPKRVRQDCRQPTDKN